MKKQQPSSEDDKLKKLVRRNWIIAAVSLALAIFAFFYFGSNGAF